ncbi:F-box domain-containing protein [Loa loa]|uniref:F-box domain-containing protein n=1 Tax=Loa loa TaxID=7209 RepID=A0A1I7VB75_LOALO|nr:F-box domain-containing protein [Loa loa]EFO27930.2 F-box domain-containing protein [Loa loa]
MSRMIDLPYELILIILNYLPSRELWQNVRLTCRFFATIIADQSYWRRKLWKKFEVELPSCHLYGSVSSLSYCCARTEEETKRWKNGKLGRLICAVGHDGTVDAVAMMKSSAHKRLCVSGARDRALIIWDVDTITDGVRGENWKLYEFSEAHQGWIWSVCKADTDMFYSCAWDRYVKQWRIVDGHLNALCDVQMGSAVLCVISDGTTVVCSTFGRRVVVMDARNSLQKITDMLYHRSAVFDLVQMTDSNYLYSCGEDRRLACVDKRMWEVVNDLELGAYAQTMSLRQGQLLCGTTDGKMLTINPSDLTITNEVFVGSGGLRQVRLNIGSQMCITKDRLFKVFTPGLRPRLFAESEVFDAEPSRFDYYDDDLVIACGDGSVFFCAT